MTPLAPSPDPTPSLSAVSSQTFEREVLASDRLVLVDFWAAYCSTCRAMEPVLTALAQEMDGIIRVVTLDVEAHPDVADRYGVRTLPTLLLFQDGKLLGQATGYVPKRVLAGHLQALAGTAPAAPVATDLVAP